MLRDLASSFGQFTPNVFLDFTKGVMPAGLTFTRSGATATRVNAQGLIETVAANIPRIDYDPVTLKCRGLLMEESRTNVVLSSCDFSSVLWGKSAGGTGFAPVVTPNYTVAPDGTSTATRIQFNRGAGTTAADYCRLSSGVGIAGPVALSIWLKTNDGTTRTLSFIAGGVGQGTTITVTPVWQRFSYVYTATFSVSSFNLFLYGNVGTDTTADISGHFAQAEAGTFVTSEIKTTSVAVTRNQETCYMDIPNVQGSAGGTLAAEWSVPVSTLAEGSFLDGVVNLQPVASGWPNVLLGFSGPYIQGSLRNSLQHGSGNFGTNRLGGLVNRAAMAWKINADTTGTVTAVAGNGVQASISAGSTSLTMLGWSRMYLGYQGRNGSSPARIVHIRKVTHYSRPLSAAFALSQSN